MDKQLIAIISLLSMLLFQSCAFMEGNNPLPTKENPSTGIKAEETRVPVIELSAEFKCDSVAAHRISRLRWHEAASIIERKTSHSIFDVYLLALAKSNLGKDKEACALFGMSISDTANPIRDYFVFDYAEALFKTDSIDKSIDLLKNIENPVLQEKALVRIFEYTHEKRDSQATFSALDTLNLEFPKHFSKNALKLVKARLHAEFGDTAKAVEFYNSVIKGNSSSNTVKAARALELLGKLTGDNLFLAGKAAVNRKFYSSGEEWLKKYISNGGKANIGEASYLQARAISRRGRYSEAVALYKKIIKEKLYNTAWCNLGIGYCFRKLRRYDEAKAHIDLAIKEGSGSNAEAEALWEGLELSEDRDDYIMAADYATRLVNKYSKHDLGDNGAMWSGLANFIEGDFSAAADRFAVINKKYSDKTFTETGEFWRALSMIANGDTTGFEILREVSNSSVRHYYKYYSKEILTDLALPNPASSHSSDWITYGEAINIAQASLSELGYNQIILSLDSPSATRAKLLARCGQIDRAQVEFRIWSQELKINPSMRLAMLSLAYDWDLTALAYQIALALVRDMGGYASAPIDVIRLAYPTFYCDLVFSSAERESIDAGLLFAVMRRESMFNPHIVSYAGAIGLFQIMPQTGENLSVRLEESKYFSTTDLYDYETSIKYGARYLADLLREYGLAEYALAEYNAGPTPLKRWKETPHEDYRSVFVESIDFLQTRHYVKNVLGDYFAYKELWDNSL
ncbi:transglycosylase SLT domain-containing protein [bacterium]|nr:transglycosylase SLT domain-containing protein [bacterium]